MDLEYTSVTKARAIERQTDLVAYAMVCYPMTALRCFEPLLKTASAYFATLGQKCSDVRFRPTPACREIYDGVEARLGDAERGL
ncbi:MAG: hypothetical protein ACJARU_000747 [Congregibacter sp.]